MPVTHHETSHCSCLESLAAAAASCHSHCCCCEEACDQEGCECCLASLGLILDAMEKHMAVLRGTCAKVPQFAKKAK